MLVLTQLDRTVFKRLVVLIALLSYYWHRMKIWQTTRSAPGRSNMNARLVRLWCFVSTILPQKSLARRRFGPFCLALPTCSVFLNAARRDWNLPRQRKSFFFPVSSCAIEGKANRRRRGVYDRRINCSGWKILEMCKGSQYLAPSHSNLPQCFHWFQRRGSWSSFPWLIHRATLCEWLTQK